MPWKNDREMYRELKKRHKEQDKRIEERNKQLIQERGKHIKGSDIKGETSRDISYECDCHLKIYNDVPKIRVYCHFPTSAPFYSLKNSEQYKHDKYKLLHSWMPDSYVYDPKRDILFKKRYPAVDDFEFVSDLDPQEFDLELKKVKEYIREKVREEVLEAIDFFAKDKPVVFTVLSDRVMIEKPGLGQSLDLKKIQKKIKKQMI